MKQKTGWKTVAGLAALAAAWLKFTESVEAPPGPPAPPPKYIRYGEATDPCPPGKYRGAYDIIKQGYVCITPLTGPLHK